MRLLVLTLAVLALGAVSADATQLPAAKRWVQVGTTNSIAGPRSTVVYVRGQSHPKGNTTKAVSAKQAKKLFALVAGSTPTTKPKVPSTCADCGASYARADGRYFKPSAAFRKEFARITG